MSTPLRSERAVVTIVTVESTNGADTGHVVLGVLGGIALVFFLVVIIVPVVRWRNRRGTSATGSRASSRRTHARIISEHNYEAVAPLLEEQPPGMTVTGNAPMVTTRDPHTSQPEAAIMLGRKILQTIPNFDDESSESSFGKPVGPKDKTFPNHDEADVRLVDGDRRSAALPPIPVSEVSSRSSTLVSSITPTSPLTNAFRRSVSLTATDTVSYTNSGSTLRYPSLASSSSKSSGPSLEVSQGGPKGTVFTHSPWLPKSLIPGSEGPSPGDTWWRTPSMPPIPESVHSGSSIHHVPETKRESSPPTARLRESNASAGPNTIRHVREASGEAPTQTSLSRSTTRHTDQSHKGSFVEGDERHVSILTHGTFGRQGHADSRETSDARPTASEEGGLVTSPVSPDKPEEHNIRRIKRRTFDFPREPSPPLDPVPLSAPPAVHFIRTGHPSRSTRSSSQPIPRPESPQDAEPEGEGTGPYGLNEEASSSSEHLLSLPSPDTGPLFPELPTLPQLSPLSFEFRLDSAAASRSNTTSTRSGSRRSSDILKGKGRGRGHGMSPSNTSSASALGSGTGSKRSLRSLASFSSNRSGLSRSRSKSREGPKHSRRVTFGDQSESNPPPAQVVVDVPAEVRRTDDDAKMELPAESQRMASRPLPTLPAMIVKDYNILLSGQTVSGTAQSRR